MAAHLRILRTERRVQRLRRPRLFKDRSNPLEVLGEESVFERYRFRPQTIIFLLGILNLTEHPTLRNSPLPPLLQLLLCLRFLATGAIHLLIGDSLNISRSTAGRYVRTVTEEILNLIDRYIRFPSGERAGQAKGEFYDLAGFPNVIGCIDGTHIKIQRPVENSPDYLNRKGFHSINVQMCCDAMFRITSCNASWPGSAHDSRIFRTSALCHRFESGEIDGFLLGDSGYPCRPFLMTPLLQPQSRPEERFNSSLCRTRVIIEQTFGILKRRFQCLHTELRTSPKQAVKYIVACVVLHNIGIEQGDVLNVDDSPATNTPANYNELADIHSDGNEVRKHIIRTFFDH